MWIFFNISLPFRTFKILANSHNVLEKLLTKLFCHFFHQPCWNIGHFSINVHTHIDNADVFFNWSISNNKIFVIKLNVIWINSDWKLKLFLNLLFIMNWSCKKKQLLTGMIQSAISNSLEKRLSFSEKRNMIQSVTNPTISSDLFFLSRNF